MRSVGLNMLEFNSSYFDYFDGTCQCSPLLKMTKRYHFKGDFTHTQTHILSTKISQSTRRFKGCR